MSTIIQFSQITLDDFMGMLDEKIKNALGSIKELSESEKGKKDFYTREETARLLKVSLATLHNWAKEGILIPQKIGKRVYYSYEVVHSKLQIGA